MHYISEFKEKFRVKVQNMIGFGKLIREFVNFLRNKINKNKKTSFFQTL